MSSYGEPASYGRGDDAYAGYDEPDSYGHYADSYASGRHSAETYPPDPYAAPSSPAGRATAGRASVGRASVGRAAVAPPLSPPPADASPRRRYDWSRSSGRAAVPVSPSPNGTATGRASVRPPGGPGGRNGRGGPGDGRPPLKKKRHWIRNTLLSIVAVCVMMAGGAMVWLSYYVDEVKAPDQLELKQASRVYYSNGREMAVLQEENREIIDTTELTVVQEAVVATEDKKFWEHSGVDFFGIARAAINNLTGGETQGASTITQQYARIAGDLHGQTYARKLKEAAMAYKLTQKYTKEEILDFYLNTVYFGRGAHGIEAAAKAYFGVSAAELDVAQAAMLAGIIRFPDDGSGLSRYDPMNENQQDTGDAEARWRWVLQQMQEINASSVQGVNIDELEMPEVIEPSSAKPWYEGPQGPIVRQVQKELEEMGITDISTGGYRITTTIDREMQRAAVRAAWRKHKDANLWEGIPKEIAAAMVAIDPTTGAVRAYFGGTDGVGFDTADWNWDEEQQQWTGGRSPGSSFKIYTLIAMLREGIAFDSHWKTTPFHPDWMADGKMVHNAGRTASSCPGGEAPDYCTLRWATQLSYNVPFAYFSMRMPNGQGPQKIMEAARDAGIKRLKDNDDVVHDLAEVENAADFFFHPIAYGQYGVSVLEHASGVATLAARGVYNKPHFVEKVEKRNEETGEWEVIAGEKIAGEQRVSQQQADAITQVLTGVPAAMWGGAGLEGGRPVAAKTGTWEADHPDGGNSDAWVVGYTPQIAAAVWVGRKDGNKAIKDQWGADINSSNLPAYIFRQFMNEAHAAKEYEVLQFPPEPFIGDSQHHLANGEKKERGRDRDRDDRRCRGLLCPPGGGDGDEQDGDDEGGDGGGLGDLGDVGDLGRPGDGGDAGGQGGGELGTVHAGDPGGRPVAIRDREALLPGHPVVV